MIDDTFVVHYLRRPGTWCQSAELATATTLLISHVTCIECLRAALEHAHKSLRWEEKGL